MERLPRRYVDEEGNAFCATLLTPSALRIVPAAFVASVHLQQLLKPPRPPTGRKRSREPVPSPSPRHPQQRREPDKQHRSNGRKLRADRGQQRYAREKQQIEDVVAVPGHPPLLGTVDA